MKKIYCGNVHEIYEISQNELVIVKTDRISARGKLMPIEITDKGIVLNKITNFWFEKTQSIIENHVIETDIKNMPSYFHDPKFKDRTVMVKKLTILPFEVIVHGYMFGRLWKQYKKGKFIDNKSRTSMYQYAEKLDEPIVTLTTKIDGIYDSDCSIDLMKKKLGEDMTNKIIDVSKKLYVKCNDYAVSKGLIIADTKFEFGVDKDNNLLLADEIFTPDSSRFWDAEKYQIGKEPYSFDKQLIRRWLDENVGESKEKFMIPDEIKNEVRTRYFECMNRLLKE